AARACRRRSPRGASRARDARGRRPEPAAAGRTPRRSRAGSAAGSAPAGRRRGRGPSAGPASAGVERHGGAGLAVGAGDDLLDPRLRCVEPGLAVPPQGLAALVEPDRFVERHVTAFELANHVLERLERLLEAHRGNIGARLVHGRGVARMRAWVKRTALPVIDSRGDAETFPRCEGAEFTHKGTKVPRATSRGCEATWRLSVFVREILRLRRRLHNYASPREPEPPTRSQAGWRFRPCNANGPAMSEITPEIVEQHGLSPEEYEHVLKALGREPNLVELGIFSVMWSEHCSYKSSRIHLKKLPTSAPWVIQGPGESAGVIDIGDGQAAIFKMESHNHPSYIEPYQGAATGVGGILRDVFTMGARPVAN